MERFGEQGERVASCTRAPFSRRFAATALLVWLLASFAACGRPPETPASAPREMPPATEPATPGSIPEPRLAYLGELSDPHCWSCSPLSPPNTLNVDLDLIAPLGTGCGNLSIWLEGFSGDLCVRGAEASAAHARFHDAAPVLRGPATHFLPDDPLVVEAAQWADQATCRTELRPDWRDCRLNMAFARHIGNALLARGEGCKSPGEAALAYRRVIRMGRLLLQDDVAASQNLVALQLIRDGAIGLARLAQPDFNELQAIAAGGPSDRLHAAVSVILLRESALIAQRVASEADAALLEYRRELSGLGLGDFARVDGGGLALRVPEYRLDHLIHVARYSPLRTLRENAIYSLHLVRHLDSAEHAQQASETINLLQRDPEQMVAIAACGALSAELSESDQDCLRNW